MPIKKRNWELEYGGIHNTHEQFFYKYKDITLLSENLFQSPGIIKNRVLQADVVKKTDLKKIFYNFMGFFKLKCEPFL